MGGSGPRALSGGTAHGPQAALAGAAPALSEYPDFESVVALIRARRDMTLLVEVESHLRLVRYSPGRIEFQPTEDAPADLAQRLGARLQGWTGARWAVSVANTGGGATLSEARAAQHDADEVKAMQNSLVLAVLEAFPKARIAEIRPLTPPEDEAATAALPEVEDEFDPDWDPFEDT
jgi:DNA polymerase-3 subunit gamma/tau